MPRFQSLGVEVIGIEPVARGDQGDAFGNLDPLTFQHRYLARVIGHESHSIKAQTPQQGRTDPEIALIILEAQAMIRLDGIESPDFADHRRASCWQARCRALPD